MIKKIKKKLHTRVIFFVIDFSCYRTSRGAALMTKCVFNIQPVLRFITRIILTLSSEPYFLERSFFEAIAQITNPNASHSQKSV